MALTIRESKSLIDLITAKLYASPNGVILTATLLADTELLALSAVGDITTTLQARNGKEFYAQGANTVFKSHPTTVGTASI